MNGIGFMDLNLRDVRSKFKDTFLHSAQQMLRHSIFFKLFFPQAAQVRRSNPQERCDILELKRLEDFRMLRYQLLVPLLGRHSV